MEMNLRMKKEQKRDEKAGEKLNKNNLSKLVLSVHTKFHLPLPPVIG